MSIAQSLGFSPERLARLDQFITRKYLEPGRMPCAQVLIARHGEIVHEFVGGQRLPQQTGLAFDDSEIAGHQAVQLHKAATQRRSQPVGIAVKRFLNEQLHPLFWTQGLEGDLEGEATQGRRGKGYPIGKLSSPKCA